MDYKRALTENVGVKILALVVALVIWFNATSQQEMTRLFLLPIRMVNIPDSLTILGNVPQEVETNITATKRQLLYLGFKKAFVEVNLSDATPGHFRQTLSVKNVILPPRINPSDVRIISPTSIDLFFERRIKRRVHVGLTLAGSLSEEYLFDEPPRVVPEAVEVSGGKTHISHLRSIPTRPVELGKVKESSEKEVELDFDTKLLQCIPDRVKVVLSISPREKRTLINIPPTIFLDNPRLLAEVTPKTLSLTLEGPKAMIDTLSSGDVSILIDLSGKRVGTYLLAPEVIVPDGIERFSTDVDSLKVKISAEKKPK